MVVHTVEGWPEKVLVGRASYVNFLQQLFDSVGGELDVKDEDEREYGQLIVYHGGKAVLVLFFDAYTEALATIGAAQP